MIKKLCITLLACLFVSGCSPNISPNTYVNSEVGVTSRVIPGTIVAKRMVNIDNSSGAGGLAGVTAGAAAGTLAGNSAATGIVGAVGGAVVGGVLGNALDKTVNHHQGYEYIIKLKNNSVISVVQLEDLNLNIKQHVLIIYGAKTRIIPDTGTNA